MPGYLIKSEDPEMENILKFNRIKAEKKRLSVGERKAKYNRYDANGQKDQYDADNSSSMTSISSSTGTSSGISLGRKLKAVCSRKPILKLSRFYHHSPIAAVQCRNCYSAIKLRQQSGANLKQVSFAENKLEKRKERHLKNFPEENFQLLVTTPMSAEDVTIGTPGTRVSQGNVSLKSQNNEMDNKNFSELISDSDTISTHGSEFPKMDDGPQQLASQTRPGSGDQSAQTEFTPECEIQLSSVSFLLCTLFTVLLGHFKHGLYAIMPHVEIILWILCALMLLSWVTNSNIGEYFEKVYQFVVGLIYSLRW